MRAFGIAPDDIRQTVEVWPDNWLAVQVFGWLATQWAVGVNGATGLRYEAFGEARRRFAVDDDAWPDLCDCLQVLEHEALRVMHAKRK